MPRKPRTDYPGALHHVMVRGIERRAIFMDDVDRTRFLVRLEAALHHAGTACLAWALMPNHAHLFLRTGHRPLAASMHILGTTYAMDFNRRYERVGHLFQNRYKALPVETDEYHLELIRYIHLNPVRAGIVPDVDALEDHPWTGHRVLMGRAANGFQAVEEVLTLMSSDFAAARIRWRAWMEAPLPPEAGAWPRRGRPRRRDAGEEAGVSPRNSASSQGVESAACRSPGNSTPQWIRANALRQEGWDLPRLIRVICERLAVSPEELTAGKRSRHVSRARAVIAWFAWSDLAISQSVLGDHLGVGASALSARMEAGRQTAMAVGIDPFREILRTPTPLEAVRQELSTEK